MRLEKKDIALLIPATLLAIAGLGPDDPWVIVPCLFLSWLSFVLICWFHEGSRRWRASIAIIITAAMAGLTYRRMGRIFEGTSNSPHPLNSVGHFLFSFWRWLWGPHGRWFDKLVGVIYAVTVLFIFLVIATAIKLVKRQREKENKGFLDYKFEAETAMQEMPRILEKLTGIMGEVAPAMSKYTEELTRAKSTAAQIGVSKRVALSLDAYSTRVDQVSKKFIENGRLLSEGLLGWSNWIKTTRPPRASFGNFPEMLRTVTQNISTANDSLTGYIASTGEVKGVSSVLNSAINRHIASWNAVLETYKKMFDACNATLEVLDGLS